MIYDNYSELLKSVELVTVVFFAKEILTKKRLSVKENRGIKNAKIRLPKDF